MTAPISTADTAPATTAFAISPHDTAPLAQIVKGIYVGGAGQVTLRPLHASADVVYRNLPDSSYIAIRASHVRATGTTATFLVGEA